MISAKQFDICVKHGHTDIALVETIKLQSTVLPIDLYTHLGNRPYSFLSQSMHQKRNFSAVSVIGLDAGDVFRIHQKQLLHFYDGVLIRHAMMSNPLQAIEHHLQNTYAYVPEKLANIPAFHGGLVGYFGYETVGYHCKQLRQGLFLDNPVAMDDVVMWQPRSLILVDTPNAQLVCVAYSQGKGYQETQKHLRHVCSRVQAALRAPKQFTTPCAAVPDSATVPTKTKQDFTAMVDTVVDYIYQGDVLQAVPSHLLSMPFADELAIPLYRQLARVNPSPYMFVLHTGDAQIIGASPEMLVAIEGDTVTTRPLAGTRPRGGDIAQDRDYEQSLLSDEKEIAEHLMLIDLARNDLGRFAVKGSVDVIEKMVVEKYANVMHISSTVSAKIQPNTSALAVLRAVHPAGTLSGAPKIRAVQIIQELEQQKRGVYGGFIAYIGFEQSLHSAIAIRVGVVKNNQLFIQAGAGVVADSDPHKEWQEVCNKKSAIATAAECVLANNQ